MVVFPRYWILVFVGLLTSCDSGEFTGPKAGTGDSEDDAAPPPISAVGYWNHDQNETTIDPLPTNVREESIWSYWRPRLQNAGFPSYFEADFQEDHWRTRTVVLRIEKGVPDDYEESPWDTDRALSRGLLLVAESCQRPRSEDPFHECIEVPGRSYRWTASGGTIVVGWFRYWVREWIPPWWWLPTACADDSTMNVYLDPRGDATMNRRCPNRPFVFWTSKESGDFQISITVSEGDLESTRCIPVSIRDDPSDPAYKLVAFDLGNRDEVSGTQRDPECPDLDADPGLADNRSRL